MFHGVIPKIKREATGDVLLDTL